MEHSRMKLNLCQIHSDLSNHPRSAGFALNHQTVRSYELQLTNRYLHALHANAKKRLCAQDHRDMDTQTIHTGTDR